MNLEETSPLVNTSERKQPKRDLDPGRVILWEADGGAQTAGVA